MATKGVFEKDLDQMLELDKGLDINQMLDTLPAIKDDETNTSEKEGDDVKKKAEDKPLKNINKVLEDQNKAAEDAKKTKDVVEDVDENKEDETPATNEQATKTTSDAPFTVIFAKDLVKQGLLSSFDEEEFDKDVKENGEAAALRNLIANEININSEAIKSDLDEGYRQYLELIGEGVPAEAAGDLVELQSRFESISPDDLAKDENVDLRKSVMADYYKLTTSMTDSKIEKMVQSSVDLGDDIEESKEFLKEIKGLIVDQMEEERAEAERQGALYEEENRRTLESLKETINTIDEVIPGVGINKQTKLKMYDSLTKEVQDGRGRVTNAVWAKRAEDPIFFDSRLAYLLETGFFDKGKTWTKAAQARTTKEVSELERVINEKKNTSSKSGTTVIRNEGEDKTLKDNIDSMRAIFQK